MPHYLYNVISKYSAISLSPPCVGFQVLDIMEKVSTGANGRPRLPVMVDECGQVCSSAASTGQALCLIWGFWARLRFTDGFTFTLMYIWWTGVEVAPSPPRGCLSPSSLSSIRCFISAYDGRASNIVIIWERISYFYPPNIVCKPHPTFYTTWEWRRGRGSRWRRWGEGWPTRECSTRKGWWGAGRGDVGKNEQQGAKAV